MTEGGTSAEVSTRDLLTGLGNRRALLAALREQVPAGQGAIILADIDHFRRACEQLSKEESQQLLVEVATRLTAAAEAKSLLYRYAGDSFCLLLPESDRDRAAATAEAMRNAVSKEPFKVGERSIDLTACTSAAAFPIDGRSPASLVESAERALFVAKHGGKNKTAVAGRLEPSALAEIGIFRGIPCPVLVGHAAEQSRLRQLAGEVRESGPIQMLIHGDPGLGKTRLVRELCSWARAQHFVVLTSTCQEERTTYPYATLADQLEALIAAEPQVIMPVIEKLEPVQRSALAVVLRNFPARGSLPEIQIADYGRLIFESLTATFEGLAKVAPLVVVADEAEFADDTTFEIYREALKHRIPFLFVATTDRALPDFDRTAAGVFIRELGAKAQRIEVQPLPPEDMRQMVRSILPDAEVPADSIEKLVAAAGGNPLYLEEAIRSLLLRGKVRMSEGKWRVPTLGPDDLPKTLEEAVRSVVSALPTRANSMLTRAAVIGQRVDPEVLQEVLGQDEAEMLDLIDEVRRSRLLLMSDSGEDLLSFPAAHARRIRLVATDSKEKREIHGRVGLVQEARHGGDVNHLADELAYHYGKAGDTLKARHFGEIARKQADLIRPPIHPGTRRTRIPPVTEELTPEAMETAVAMLRHFTGVLKVGRLYPQWSQVGAGFLSQLRSTMNSLLSSCAGVTVITSSAGTTINGMAAEAPAVADFAALMDDRLIESITILTGFDPEKIEVIIRAFVEPMDRARAAPDLWDRFLTREGIEALDIIQKTYQAREMDRRSGAIHGDKAVPSEDVPLVRDSIRALKAAVDNLKLYPPGHPLVEESAATLCTELAQLLSKVPAVTFAIAEGNLVINGMPADKKYFSDAGTFLAREIETRDLKSVSIWTGLRNDEIRALVSFLSMPAGEPDVAGDVESLLNQLVHVAMGSRNYERSTDGGDTELDLHPPPKPIRSELRAREHLAKPYERFLTPELEHQFPVLVESLAYGALKPMAEQLVERLGLHFHDAELPHRQQAYQILTRSMAFASPTTRKLEVLKSIPALQQRLVQDVIPQFFRAAANVLPVWIPAAATVGCLKELADVANATLRKRADAQTTPPEVAAVCESALQLIPQCRAYPQILASIGRTDSGDRESAIRILLAVGGPALERLVETLAEEADLAPRKQMAASLAAHAEALGGELARCLQTTTPPERVIRVLQVIEPLLSPALAPALATLIESGAADVRKEALKSAEKWPKPLAASIVKKLLSGPAETRDTGLELATKLKLEQLAPEVGRLLEGATEEKVMVTCSRYFEAVPNPASVPMLIKIVQTRPKFFGMVKGFSTPTRAAAVRALVEQKSHQAEEVVNQAVRDGEIRALMNTEKAVSPKP